MADEGFEKLRKSGDKKSERNLIQLADVDTVEEPRGLHFKLETVLSWQGHPQLGRVRKARIGRHRAYITGRHTDCVYFVRYIKVFKKSDVDREEEPNFRDRILRALSMPAQRELVSGSRADEWSGLEL